MWSVNFFRNSYSQLIVVIVLFSAVTAAAYSQSYFHSPNDTLTSYTTVNNSVTMNITQVHTNNDTLQFVWKKFYVSLPAEWTAKICDNTTCYESLIDSSTTLPVFPGDDGLMLIHCYPNTNPGTGIIRYTIYEIHSPFQVDTLTWIINSAPAAAVDASSSIYSPYTLTGNQFKLTDPAFTNLILADLNGKEVFSSTVSTSVYVQTPLLPANFYYLILSGTNNIIRQKIWYSTN
jgi:hypothetical protein